MKYILYTVSPYTFYLICEGIKTTLLQKIIPKSYNWAYELELYCSADLKSFNMIPDKYKSKYTNYLGKIGAHVICDTIRKYDYISNVLSYADDCSLYNVDTYFITKNECKSICMTMDEIRAYGKKKPIYGWHIKNVQLYNTPYDLSNYSKYELRNIDKSGVCTNTLCKYKGNDNTCSISNKYGCTLDAPPKNWRYAYKCTQ